MTTAHLTAPMVAAVSIAAEAPAATPDHRLAAEEAVTVRVVLPAHLRTLARVDREIALAVAGAPTQRAVLDALEVAYPMLSGTIRGQTTKLRRPLVRFFACGDDLSHTSPDDLLPERVASGAEPFVVIGAMAGG